MLRTAAAETQGLILKTVLTTDKQPNLFSLHLLKRLRKKEWCPSESTCSTSLLGIDIQMLELQFCVSGLLIFSADSTSALNPPKWLSLLHKLPNVHLFWRVCLCVDLARAWESKPRHWSLGTVNSAICYSTMGTTKKTDFICSAAYGFHKDPVLQGAIAAASTSALPTGALGEWASKPLICLSSLPPSLYYSFT